jgi:hypothetical protein
MTDQPTTETRVLERTLSHRLDSKPVTVKSMWRGVRAEQTPLIEALREALTEMVVQIGEPPFCPCCGNHFVRGHTAPCALDAAIALLASPVAPEEEKE